MLSCVCAYESPLLGEQMWGAGEVATDTPSWVPWGTSGQSVVSGLAARLLMGAVLMVVGLVVALMLGSRVCGRASGLSVGGVVS